jgi:SNF2 family DNA or RNA helicase
MDEIYKALIYLSERCDGAIAEDGRGFNSSDSLFGKSLANQVKQKGGLTPKQNQIALSMLRKYKGQLLEGCIHLPDSLEVTPGVSLTSGYSTRVLTPGVTSTRIIKSVDKDYFYLSFSYDKFLIDSLKKLDGVTCKKKEDQYIWFFPVEREDLLEEVLNLGFEVSSHAKEQIEILRANQARRREKVVYRVNWCLQYLKSLEMPRQPFKHQCEAIETFLNYENLRGLITDEQGLGKSLTSLLIAKAVKAIAKENGIDIRIFIVCPVSLKLNWLEEAELVSEKVEVFSYGKMPEIPESSYMLIFDECHLLQNLQSIRTKKALALSDSPKCQSVIGLTGTPLKNGRPSNLFPLLKLIKHPLAKDKTSFEKRYCGATANAFSNWDITGATNLEELRVRISDKVIRRTKEECLDLPSKIFQVIYCEKNADADLAYEAKIEELEEKHNQDLAIVRLGDLRLAASIYKSFTTIEKTEELLEQGSQVVIFTEFIESAWKIANHFGVTPLTGEMKTEDRQQLKVDFQEGKTKVFVGTIRAGGVGITLTKANYLIMNDYPWTSGDFDQATDRIHRIGQTQNCTIYEVIGKDIDYVMAKVIGKKRENINTVLKKKGLQEIYDKKGEIDYSKIVQKLIKEK